MLRPSMDLGRLANEYEPELPRAFRFLTRGLGTRETRSNDMLSLVMFQSDYVSRLIELGEEDAMRRVEEIRAFLCQGGPAKARTHVNGGDPGSRLRNLKGSPDEIEAASRSNVRAPRSIRPVASFPSWQAYSKIW